MNIPTHLWRPHKQRLNEGAARAGQGRLCLSRCRRAGGTRCLQTARTYDRSAIAGWCWRTWRC